MYEDNFTGHGFSWVDFGDADSGVVSFLRRSKDGREQILCVFNLTPVPRTGYRVGVPAAGYWREIANSDALEFGGSGMGNLGGVEADWLPWQGQPHSLNLTLPPLSASAFKRIL